MFTQATSRQSVSINNREFSLIFKLSERADPGLTGNQLKSLFCFCRGCRLYMTRVAFSLHQCPSQGVGSSNQAGASSSSNGQARARRARASGSGASNTANNHAIPGTTAKNAIVID
ncbi:hypothetical protein HGRIS_004171 [Hohenbuehelia grisea]|uniref:Uncharacterized protein n=1 Tax=Hohenbuehelia grisea TaxID=104357 RepID=A0ABR3JIB2_9AGAR